MNKKAFKMKLKPNCKEEYKKRHDEIWAELKRELKEAGVYDYTIYLDEDTNILFAVQKLKEDHQADRLPQLEIMQKWWNHMADLMEVEDDNSPVEIPLKEMFHMD